MIQVSNISFWPKLMNFLIGLSYLHKIQLVSHLDIRLNTRVNFANFHNYLLRKN